MGQILIRNIDDAVLAELKERARRNERSTEAELRAILTEAVRGSESGRRRLTDFIGAAKSGRTTEEINAYVRALRDEWER